MEGTFNNTGVDIMTKFFDVQKYYANDTITDGVEILDEAVRAVSFYSSLYEAVDAFTYDVTRTDIYEDTYERLRETCGIILGDDEDYTVDTGAVSGYNAGGDTVKNAYDIVPEPAGAILSEQEMPAAGSTKTVSYYGNDGSYHSFTITAPDNFHTVFDDEKEIDVSDDADKLALIQSCSKGINAWWFEQAAKLAYDSYGLDFDGVNITYSFAINADYTAATAPDDDTRSIVDTTPGNEIKISVGLDFFKGMDPDDPNGFTTDGVDFLDRVLAHEFIHATSFKAGVMKNNMPQFFTEGVADLVQGNDDYSGGYTSTLSDLAESYRNISHALRFKAGTGFDNADAYPGGYMFLRWLINQNLNTEIVSGGSYTYAGGNAVVTGGDVTYDTEITGVELSNGDYLISSPTGALLLRDAGTKNLNLGTASISGENFTINDATGSLRIGSEYLSLDNATATFNLANNSASILSGEVSGFSGGEYIINGETVSLGAGDTVTSATIISGDVEISDATITGGANVTVTGGDWAADTLGATVNGNDAIFYTSSGNITVLDGASLLGISTVNTLHYTGVAGTRFNDTITSADKGGSFLNGRGGDDFIYVHGGNSVELYGGDGNDTLEIFAGTKLDTLGIKDYYSQNATIDAGDGNDSIVIGENFKDATVIFSSGDDTLSGCNSTTQIFVTEIPSVIQSGGNVIISGKTGTLTVTDASADDMNLVYSIFNVDEGAEIFLGDGNNEVTNVGGGSEIVTGDGDDTILNDSSGATIRAGGGDNSIDSRGKNNFLEAGDGDDNFELEENDSGSTISAGGGDNVIEGYNSTTRILATAIDSEVDGDDFIITTADGTITVTDGADKIIYLVDADGNETALNGDETSSVLKKASDIFQVGERVFRLSQNVPTGITVNAGENDFEIAHTAAGKIITEKITIAGDDSYTVDSAEYGVNVVSGLSSGASVTFDGVDASLTFVTDEDGTFTFGDKTYTITGGSVQLEVSFSKDGAAISNGSDNVTIRAGAGDDTITNTDANNFYIDAGGGSDSILNFHSYYNTVDAGDGADIVVVGNGHHQYVDAGAGNDTIRGNIFSGEYDNWAMGGYATLFGGEGDDYISTGFANNALIDGGAGDDTIITDGEAATIDGGDGADFIQIGKRATGNVIITSGDDTISGVNSTTTIQGGSVENISFVDKNVILKTDEGTVTILDGRGKILNVNDEQLAAGEFKISEPTTLNGMAFSGAGKITLSGENVTLSAGVAVDGAENVVLAKRGTTTINGQTFWLTEKVPAGVTVSTFDDGIGAAHIVTADDVPAGDTVDVGKIFYEEAYIYGDDSYGVRIDAGGLRSIYNISSGATVDGKGSLETAIGSGEYEEDYSVLVLGLAENGTYTFGDEEYTIGELTSDTPVGVNVHYESDGSVNVSRVRYLDGNTISGNFSSVSVGGSAIVSIDGDDSIDITGSRKKASAISGVSDGATIYSAGGASKISTDEEGEFVIGAQKFTVDGDTSATFLVDKDSVTGVTEIENGALIFDTSTSEISINDGENLSVAASGEVTLTIADGKISSVNGVDTIKNLSGNATIHAAGNIVVNKSALSVAGDDDFDVVVSDGAVASIVDIDDGATISASRASIATASEGTFKIGENSYTVDGSAVNFVTDRNGRVVDIQNLDGTLISSSAKNTVNGADLELSNGAGVSIFGNGGTLVSIAGFHNQRLFHDMTFIH